MKKYKEIALGTLIGCVAGSLTAALVRDQVSCCPAKKTTRTVKKVQAKPKAKAIKTKSSAKKTTKKSTSKKTTKL